MQTCASFLGRGHVFRWASVEMCLRMTSASLMSHRLARTSNDFDPQADLGSACFILLDRESAIGSSSLWRRESPRRHSASQALSPFLDRANRWPRRRHEPLKMNSTTRCDLHLHSAASDRKSTRLYSSHLGI